MLIEYPDVPQRQAMLARLKGLEDLVHVQVAGCDPVRAIADEGLDRENEEKTSSVRFLRFELSPATVAALKSGAALSVGVHHNHYQALVSPISASLRQSLLQHLDSNG